MPHITPSRRAAFTLVELLVVIAIIAVTLSLLIPALQRAKQEANVVRCAANQKGIALGVVGYAADNRGALPPSVAKDVNNTYYNLWSIPTALQTNSTSTDPATLAFSGGGSVYRLLGDYLPNVRLFFCPLDAPKWAGAQADYVNSNIGSQAGSTFLLWNWNGGTNTGFNAKVRLEDNRVNLLTSDSLYNWTGAGWSPTPFWVSSHPYSGGVPTAPIQWGSYHYGLNLGLSMPQGLVPLNASYVDGHVARVQPADTSYFLMGDVPQVRIYLPSQKY